MGKTYKVHRNFDQDWMTIEDPCRCSSPVSGWTIFDQANLTVVESNSLEEYNATMNGTVNSASDIKWEGLSKSHCEA